MTRYYDDDDEDHIDMRPLLRLGAWGACAALALGAAVVAGHGDAATERVSVALATLRAAPDFITHPTMVLTAARPSPNDEETERLNETVRTLTADRDQLADRVATLERNLSDLTGSVSHDQQAVTATSQPAAPTTGAPATAPSTPAAPAGPTRVRLDDKLQQQAAIAFPPAAPLDAGGTATDDAHTPAPTVVAAAPVAAPVEPPQPGVGLPANVPLPRPGPLATIQSYVNSSALPAAATQRIATAAPVTDANASNEPAPKEFAVELAIATNVNALRARWTTIRNGHGALVEGLRPLIAVRDSTRPGFTEFHLVAGPVADADAATRLCSAMASAKIPCRPAPFNGQNLDLR
jgi:hypothetical protein